MWLCTNFRKERDTMSDPFSGFEKKRDYLICIDSALYGKRVGTGGS